MNTNIESYKIIFEIENQLRKLFIDLIKRDVLKNVTNLFDLNINNQLKKNIIDHAKELMNKEAKELIDDDSMILKLYKLYCNAFKSDIKLYNPIYYLTFSELTSILKRDPIQSVLIQKFTNENIKITFSYLDKIVHTRNDIAHNRYIHEEQLTYLKTFYSFIKDVLKLDYDLDIQNDVENIKEVTSRLKQIHFQIKKNPQATKEEINTIKDEVKKLNDSFWNTLFYNETKSLFENIFSITNDYSSALDSIGGTFKLVNLHPKLILELETIINKYE